MTLRSSTVLRCSAAGMLFRGGWFWTFSVRFGWIPWSSTPKGLLKSIGRNPGLPAPAPHTPRTTAMKWSTWTGERCCFRQVSPLCRHADGGDSSRLEGVKNNKTSGKSLSNWSEWNSKEAYKSLDTWVVVCEPGAVSQSGAYASLFHWLVFEKSLHWMILTVDMHESVSNLWLWREDWASDAVRRRSFHLDVLHPLLLFKRSCDTFPHCENICGKNISLFPIRRQSSWVVFPLQPCGRDSRFCLHSLGTQLFLPSSADRKYSPTRLMSTSLQSGLKSSNRLF